jgi:hypothetical protein
LQIRLGSKYLEKKPKLEIFLIEGITFGTTLKVPSNLFFKKEVVKPKVLFKFKN